MYLYKDLWKILLQHLWNHYITTLSTVRETCVHIEQGISAHMVRWDLNEGLVFVRRLVRGLVLTLRYQSKRYRVGIYTLVSSKLAMWTHSFPLNWCSVFPIRTAVCRCYGKRIVRCFIPEVDRWAVGTVFEFVMSWPAVSLRYYCTFGIGMQSCLESTGSAGFSWR